MNETRYQIVAEQGMALQHEIFLFATSKADAEDTFRHMIESFGGSLEGVRLSISED